MGRSRSGEHPDINFVYSWHVRILLSQRSPRKPSINPLNRRSEFRDPWVSPVGGSDTSWSVTICPGYVASRIFRALNLPGAVGIIATRWPDVVPVLEWLHGKMTGTEATTGTPNPENHMEIECFASETFLAPCLRAHWMQLTLPWMHKNKLILMALRSQEKIRQFLLSWIKTCVFPCFVISSGEVNGFIFSHFIQLDLLQAADEKSPPQSYGESIMFQRSEKGETKGPANLVWKHLSRTSHIHICFSECHLAFINLWSKLPSRIPGCFYTQFVVALKRYFVMNPWSCGGPIRLWSLSLLIVYS